jgi:CHAD domain-containing protein
MYNPEQLEQPDPQFKDIDFPPVVDEPADPAWDLGTYAQHTILRLFKALLAQRRVVWDNQEVEGVHQIRVSARRCRTALQTFGALWDADEVRRRRKYLSRFADAFGRARDLDVMVIYLSELLAGAAGERRTAYAWLLQRNIERRRAEQPKLERVLLKLEESDFARDFVGFFAHRPVDLWARGRADG